MALTTDSPISGTTMRVGMRLSSRQEPLRNSLSIFLISLRLLIL